MQKKDGTWTSGSRSAWFIPFDFGSKMRKPIASLSLDLDNKWSYMKTHGDAGWESFPVVPGYGRAARH